MIILDDFIQGSDEWFEARAGIPTASEWDQLVDSKWQVRTGEMPRTYLHKKLAEAWSGPQIAWIGAMGDQGQMKESLALPWFEMQYDVDVRRVGLCKTDDGKLGASPDGLVGEEYGIECKTPEGHTMIGYLLNNKAPKEHLCQIHGSMLVTGLPRWKFLAYRPKYPPLVVTVERDEKIQAALKEALDGFLSQFEAGLARLTEMAQGNLPTWRRKALERKSAVLTPENSQKGLSGA